MTLYKCRATISKKPYGRLKCILDVCHHGDHEDVSHLKWKNRGLRKPAQGVCGATPRGGDGTAVCVLRPRHKARHQDQLGAFFSIRARRIRKIPTRGFLVKITEWRELNRRVSSLLKFHDQIPDSPDWPPGSQGRHVQGLRKLMRLLDQRFKERD